MPLTGVQGTGEAVMEEIDVQNEPIHDVECCEKIPPRRQPRVIRKRVPSWDVHRRKRLPPLFNNTKDELYRPRPQRCDDMKEQC